MMTTLFRTVALLEGLSYLALFANMLLLKPNYFELYKIVLFPLGMVHGLLFVAYVALAFILRKQQGWSWMDLCYIQVASLLPFGTFFIEKKYF